MATSVLESRLFLASELMASGVELAPVFRLAATLCERGPVSAKSAEVCEDVAVEPSSEPKVVSSTDNTWHAAAARMDALPARPAIEREKLKPGVCMLDNRTGVLRLVSPTGQVYRPERVLLDSGAQPLMLGKPAVLGLGLRRSELEECPFKISTSTGGTR